jgi:hypothetical protein
LAVLLPTGCSSDEDEGTIIQRVDLGHQIEDFFNSEWADYNNDDVYPSTFFNHDERGRDKICLINSQEELSKIYQGTKEIPEIDFSKYTLIVGQQKRNVEIGKESTGKFLEQKLFQTEDGYQMNLYCNSIIPDAVIYRISYIYYWGLYPKQDIKNITVNIKLVK